MQSRPGSSDRARPNPSSSSGFQHPKTAPVHNLATIHLQKGPHLQKGDPPKGLNGLLSNRTPNGAPGTSGFSSNLVTNVNLAEFSPSGALKTSKPGQVTQKQAERSSARSPRGLDDPQSHHATPPPKLFGLLNSLKDAQAHTAEWSSHTNLRLGVDDLQKANMRRALKESKPLDTPDGLGLTLSARSQYTPPNQVLLTRDKLPRSYAGLDQQ